MRGAGGVWRGEAHLWKGGDLGIHPGIFPLLQLFRNPKDIVRLVPHRSVDTHVLQENVSVARTASAHALTRVRRYARTCLM